VRTDGWTAGRMIVIMARRIDSERRLIAQHPCTRFHRALRETETMTADA